jgi:hypothetical protein
VKGRASSSSSSSVTDAACCCLCCAKFGGGGSEAGYPAGGWPGKEEDTTGTGGRGWFVGAGGAFEEVRVFWTGDCGSEVLTDEGGALLDGAITGAPFDSGGDWGAECNC